MSIEGEISTIQSSAGDVDDYRQVFLSLQCRFFELTDSLCRVGFFLGAFGFSRKGRFRVFFSHFLVYE